MEANDIRSLIQKAQTFYQQGRLNLAVNEYLKITNIDPYNITALNALGDIYSRLGDFQKAYSMYQKVAKLYIENNELTKAIGIYKKIITLDENNGKAYYELGKLYENEGMTTEALNCYVKATEHLNTAFDDEIIKDIYGRMSKLDPDNIDLHLDMAKKFIEAGNKNEARDEIITVIKSYLNKGEIEKAEEQLTLLSSIVSEDYVNFAKALIAQQKGEYGIAENLLKKVIAKQPYFVDAYFELGNTRLKAGKKPQAKIAFNQCQNVKKDYIPVLEILGDINYEEGNLKGALKKYQEALEFALEKSQLKDVKKYLKKILKIDPNNIAAREKLKQFGEDIDDSIVSSATMSKSDTDENTLKEAAKVDASDIETNIPQNIMDIPTVNIDFQTKRKIADLLDEASTFNNQGIIDKAEENFKKVLDIDPNNEHALKALAEISMFSGKNDDALKYYKHLIKVYYNRLDYDNALNIYDSAKKLKNDPDLDKFKEEIYKKKSLLEQVEQVEEAHENPPPPITPEKQQPINEKQSIPQSAPTSNQGDTVKKVDEKEFIGDSLEDSMDKFQDAVDEEIGDDIKGHFDMGMAFYSMQLFSKAIVEFQKVVNSGNEELFLPAIEQIAQCFLDQGFYEASIKWINRGLEKENIDENTRLKFKFLLGQALEQMGEKQKALQVYLEIYEVNARFQGVNKIIKKLKEELNIKKNKTVADEVISNQTLEDMLGQNIETNQATSEPTPQEHIPKEEPPAKKNDDKDNNEPPQQNPKISFL